MKLINDFFEVIALTPSEGELRCKVKFNPEHFIYKAHFPGNPITPGVCLMQMGEELLEQKNGQQLQLSTVKSIRFKKIVGPNDMPTFTFTKEVLNEGRLSVEVAIADAEGEFVTMVLQYQVEA